MHDATALTDDDALLALKFLSHQSDLCLVKISCLDKASGQFTAPNIGSLLEQSQGEDRLYWLAINTASHVDSILFIDLYAEKFLKLIRKLNRGPRALRFEVAVSLVGSADAFTFYQGEEPRLLAACNRVRSGCLRQVVVLALNTGMRRGELLSLRWNQVDMINRSIRILNGKTKSSGRTIPINTTVYNLLSELQSCEKSDLVFPSNRKPGQRILDLKKGFQKAISLAKLERRIRFHDLRHTFATRLVNEGANIVRGEYRHCAALTRAC